MRTLILLRHAAAGDRATWAGADRLRPLDERGRAQAERLVPLLADLRPEVIVTSPYVRCVQTVAPLAVALGLDVTEDERLVTGAPLDDVLQLLREARGGVFCTHADITDAVAARPLKKGAAAYLEPRSLRPLGTVRPIA